MIRTLIIAAFFCPTLAAAQTLSIPLVPEVGVTVEPAEALSRGWYVEGQIVVTVRVASQRPFEALELDLPDFDGFDVIELMRPRTRRIRSYAGEGFALETALALFPREPGDLFIPPIRAAGMVRDAAGAEIRFDDATDPLPVAVDGPPAAYPGDWWLVSPRVSISETWSKPPTEARVGDVIRREVTVVADGVTAERLRPPELPSSKSVPVVDAGSTSRTITAASGVSAEVTRAWDLAIQDGVYSDVAPIGVTYWDPVARKVARAFLPGLRLEPLPADAEAVARRLMAEATGRRDDARLAAALALAILAAPLLALGLLWLWAASPRPADWRLRRELAAAEKPEAAWRALRRWASANPGEEGEGPLSRDAGALVFGAGDFRDGLASLAPDLTRAARAARLHRLRRSLAGLTVWLIGPAIRLNTADRRPNQKI